MRFLLIGILLAFLAGAIYVGHYGWTSAGDVTMPAWGWMMMGLGIFFTLVVGGGLMALIFYSSRAGYDEAPQIEYDEEPEDSSTAASTPPGSGVRKKGGRKKPSRRQRDKTTRLHA